MNTDILGTIAGVLTSISMVPQLVKVWKEKNVEDISGLMLCVLIAGLSLWVWYGIEKTEWPIILSNGFAVLVNITLLTLFLIYRKR